MIETNNKSILLHCCCAPCAGGCVEKLLDENYKVILYFSNSNLSDEKEFNLRLNSVQKLAEIFSLELIVDEYSHYKWLEYIAGLEHEKEKGLRCNKCFDFSFKRSYNVASNLKIQFTTSLSVSPHKSSKVLFDIGANYENFVPIDFKKQNGFLKSRNFAKLNNFYLQNFCGCEFSKRG